MGASSSGFINDLASTTGQTAPFEAKRLFHDLDNPLDRIVTVSQFADVRALTVRARSISLRELAAEFPTFRAAEKDRLPLIKLAVFGNVRTAKGSLRHDANLVSVDGVEGDYDGEAVSMEEASDRLAASRIAGVILPTPSHAPDAPRWRVLCPTSRPLEPGSRRRLCDRLNRALGGVLSPESYTASQAFYFGTVAAGASPVLVDGRFVDLAPDLDAAEPVPSESEIEDIGHLRSEPDLERVEAALARIPEAERDGRDLWLKVGMALHHAYAGGDTGFDLWSTWSAASGKFDPEDQRRTWDSFRPDGSVTIGTLYHLAGKYEAPATDGLRLLSPSDCADAPKRGYVIKGLLAPGDVGCIFGEPGTGKSLLAPLLGYKVAQGERAFGLRTRRGEVLYVAAEDPSGMRGRISTLRDTFGEAPGFFLVDGVSDLFSESGDLPALSRIVADRKPALVLIDTLALAFPGLEENAGGPEGMGRVIEVSRSLASHGAAVVLIHHGTKADGSTPRGHSSFNGALDMSLMLKREPESDLCRGSLRKNRNGSCEARVAFSIGIAEHGLDDDGDRITTAYALERLDAPTTGKRLSDSERAALTVLVGLDEGDGVSEADWRRACVEGRAVSASDTPKSRGRAFARAYQALVRAGRVECRDGRVSASGEGPTAHFDDLSDVSDLSDLFDQ